MSGMADLPAMYRRYGLVVSEVPGWRTRGHDGDVPIHPTGGLWHHTGDNAGMHSVYNTSGPDVRPDVPQPRANVWIPRNRGATDVYVIAAGRAYHAGRGSARVLGEVAAGRISATTKDAGARGLADDTGRGNSALIGHEVENLGTGQALTAQQLRAIPRIAAAECELFGWTIGHHTHHRTYTRRKTDMQWHGDLWSLTAAVLHNEGDDDMPTLDEIRKMMRDVLDERLGRLGIALNDTPNSVFPDRRIGQMARDVDTLTTDAEAPVAPASTPPAA